MGEGEGPLLVCTARIKEPARYKPRPGEPGVMGLGARLVQLVGRRSTGAVLFTLAYLASLASFHAFFREHPEARGPILGLAILTSVVYFVGLAILALYYRGG